MPEKDAVVCERKVIQMVQERFALWVISWNIEKVGQQIFPD
jgi:hypothetical protein